VGGLNDYFAAKDDTAAMAAMATGPQAAGFPSLDAKSIDPVVTMASLEAILTGGDTLQVIHANRDAPVSQAGEQGPWLVRIRHSLTTALCETDEARLRSAANSWASTEELRGSDAQGLYAFLLNFAQLSRRASANGEAIYCWMSL